MVSCWTDGCQRGMDDWEGIMERGGAVKTCGVANVPEVGSRAGVWKLGIRVSSSGRREDYRRGNQTRARESEPVRRRRGVEGEIRVRWGGAGKDVTAEVQRVDESVHEQIIVSFSNTSSRSQLFLSVGSTKLITNHHIVVGIFSFVSLCFPLFSSQKKRGERDTRAHAESERVEWSHPLLSSSPRARVTRVQERGRERKRIKARIGEKECRQSAKDVDTAPTALALARKEEETKRDDAVRDKILLE